MRAIRVVIGVLGAGGCASAGSGIEPHAADAATSTDAATVIDSPAGVSCSTAITCQGAPMLGTVSGDTGSQMLTAAGHQAGWHRVRVTEDHHVPLDPKPLRVSATLTSPTGVDFDVLVYVNASDDVPECSTTRGTGSTTGAIDLVKTEWGDVQSSESGRDVAIEIRHVSGACAPAAKWQLAIEGNW